MRILDHKVYKGRNIYSHRPVIKLTLDLESYTGKTTDKFPLFQAGLLAVLPGLKEHHCSRGKAGGLWERLQEGTYFGHVVEHVILELQELAGVGTKYGKTSNTDVHGVVEIVFEYRSQAIALFLAELALKVVDRVFQGSVPDLKSGLAVAEQIRAARDPGPSTAAIINEARKRGIPVLTLKEGTSLLQLGTGCHQKRVWATLTQQTGCIAADIAGDKALTKELLEEMSIPTPPGQLVFSTVEALAVWRKFGSPVVIKPQNGNQGNGVSLNLNSEQEICAAFMAASQFSPGVIVEEYIHGRQYRLLVVGNKVVAAAERIPAQVTGNGRSTVRELVEAVNSNSRRGFGHEKPLTRIKLDDLALNILAQQNLSPKSRPAQGQVVYLRMTTNLSTGGSAIDVTKKVHPFNKRLALRAAAIVGLDVAGVDLISPDIAIPLNRSGAIIEVNAAPGIRMHHYPSGGRPRNVAAEIVKMLYPAGTPCRIPLISVTGTNGKTTTTRLITHILRQGRQFKNVGMATTDGVYVNETCLMEGDATGPASAGILLRDSQVEIAVLETARGGLVRAGLGYDGSDVGVLTNISADHFGQDGIKDIEDLLYIKSLVIEAVYPQGTAVLNADDPNVLRVAERARCRIIYFSQKSDNLVIRRHLEKGNIAVIVVEDCLFMARGDKIERLLPVNEVPLTMGGKARHNVENVLSAISACLGLNLKTKHILAGLRSFATRPEHNPGRCNLFCVGPYRALLDYGHNPAGIAATLELARGLNPKRLIGVVGVPGDRCNDLIRSVGQVSAGGLDLIFFKEDRDLRGRRSGEVASILYEGALSSGGNKKYMRIVLDELKATERAFKEAQQGDLVVVFFEKRLPLIQLLETMSKEMAYTVFYNKVAIQN